MAHANPLCAESAQIDKTLTLLLDALDLPGEELARPVAPVVRAASGRGVSVEQRARQMMSNGEAEDD